MGTPCADALQRFSEPVDIAPPTPAQGGGSASAPGTPPTTLDSGYAPLHSLVAPPDMPSLRRTGPSAARPVRGQAARAAQQGEEDRGVRNLGRALGAVKAPHVTALVKLFEACSAGTTSQQSAGSIEPAQDKQADSRHDSAPPQGTSAGVEVIDCNHDGDAAAASRSTSPLAQSAPPLSGSAFARVWHGAAGDGQLQLLFDVPPTTLRERLPPSVLAAVARAALAQLLPRDAPLAMRTLRNLTEAKSFGQALLLLNDKEKADVVAAWDAAESTADEEMREALRELRPSYRIDDIVRPAPWSGAGAGAPAPVPPSTHLRAGPQAQGGDGARGLSNSPGELNCFLNAVLQSLWHLRTSFRPALNQAVLPPEATSAPPGSPLARDAVVATTLKAIFEEMSHSSMPAGGAGAAAVPRVAVAPTSLRLALAALSPSLCRAGAMADAAEALSVLFEAVHRCFAAGGRVGADASPVASCFALSVQEVADCVCCGRATHCLSYTAYYHLVQAATLWVGGLRGPRPRLEEVLRAARQDTKNCDRDAGGCGAPAPVRHSLADSALPSVFTLVVGWESRRASQSAIAATLKTLTPTLHPHLIYASPPGATYALRSLVCFHGAHYVSLVRADDCEGTPWQLYDDVKVLRVGAWEELLQVCQKGMLQPVVCIYER